MLCARREEPLIYIKCVRNKRLVLGCTVSDLTDVSVIAVEHLTSYERKPSHFVTSSPTRSSLLYSTLSLPSLLRPPNLTRFPSHSSHSGISSTRLELLETRLKADVLSELTTFDSRLLLHSEATDGSVNPLWETISSPPSTNVLTLREIFDLVSKATVRGSLLRYHRVPITAEKSPDFSDVKEIVELVTKLPASGGGGEGGEGGGGREGAIVVNCQLGRGRSTRAMVIIMLVKRWLNGSGELGKAPKSTRYSYTCVSLFFCPPLSSCRVAALSTDSSSATIVSTKKKKPAASSTTSYEPFETVKKLRTQSI